MIKLKDYTPSVYYKESRDFQLLGRLFDVVLNSVKTEADLMYYMPVSDNSNDKLLNLLALTLGFKANKQYNSKQLRAICSVFPEIIRNKGSIKAVQVACNALFNASGAEQNLDYDFTANKDKMELNLYIPQDFGDVSIITNLLSYVLPAGMSCNIIRELRYTTSSMTEIDIDSIFKLYDKGDIDSNNSTDTEHLYFYNDALLSVLPRLSNTEETNRNYGILNTEDLLTGKVEDLPGLLANSSVSDGSFKISKKEDSTDE